MEVLRTIGQNQLLIETSEPCGISLDEDLASRIGATLASVVGKQKLLRSIAYGDDYFPLTTHWEMWDRCNLACPFCYIVGHSFNRVVRFTEVEKHLSDLVDAGLLFCTLTGGEALLHPDFKEVYRFLKERGVIVDVFSNGLFIEPDTLKLFADLPPAAVEVSLYSFDNDRMSHLFGARIPDAASTVKANVLRMKATGINVVCKSFINRLTAAEAPAIEAWCMGNGVDYYSSAEVNQAYDGTDLQSFKILQPARLPSLNSGGNAVCLPCGTKNYGSAITSSFGIYPCPSIKLPDCVFDVRALGVGEAIRRMKAFMRRFQNQEIQSSPCGSKGCASCIAYAKPVRDDSGKITHFVQPE